jgi:hypothetical protein
MIYWLYYLQKLMKVNKISVCDKNSSICLSGFSQYLRSSDQALPLTHFAKESHHILSFM